MIGLIENANNWLILGTILIIIELFLIGSFVVFLPAGLAAILIGIIYKIQISTSIIILAGFGAKIKDSELIGIPMNIIIGKLYVEKNEIEMRTRDGQISLVQIDDLEVIFNHFK